MLKHMEMCDDKDKFLRFLPPGTMVEHKTGSVDAANTSAGIIYVRLRDRTQGRRRPIAVCVMTDENKDQRGGPTMPATCFVRRSQRLLYDHFAANKGGGP